VCADQFLFQISWLHGPATPTDPWPTTVIDAGPRPMGTAVADIDRDGRPDVVAGMAWYRLSGGTWTKHPYTTLQDTSDPRFNDYARVSVLDLNGDGRLDMAGSTSVPPACSPPAWSTRRPRSGALTDAMGAGWQREPASADAAAALDVAAGREARRRRLGTPHRARAGRRAAPIARAAPPAPRAPARHGPPVVGGAPCCLTRGAVPARGLASPRRTRPTPPATCPTSRRLRGRGGAGRATGQRGG